MRLPQAAIKRLVTGLLQLVLLANRPARLARSGFVLPTTVLLVLMVVLTATALTYRSFTRSDMAISQREQQVIANAATPALDRARAKIEFIFNRDTRFTSGLPNSDFLASMMLATPTPATGVVALPGDPFTLPGETRLDINNDGDLDNAWSFVSDANGETIVYSILVDDEGTRADPTATGAAAQRVSDPVDQDKASALITRTGPLATTEALSSCANARAEGGWQVVSTGSTATLQKNFQINVFVPNANNVNRTVEAFEFQQSRIANRGNKWAAWFRYDMEVYPGRAFNINGAMHTDGNLMVDGEGAFTSYMISSQNSCVYGKQASEVTVGAANDDGVEGQIVKGVTSNAAFGSNGGAANFHVWTTDNDPPDNRTLTTANDSVNNGSPGDVATNPLVLFAQDKLQHTTTAGWNRDNAAWDANDIRIGDRVLNKRVTKPFVDDFSRADNRWGPKPRYSDTIDALDLTSASNPNQVGDKIAATPALTDPVAGLDGYWERQAVNYGLRLVVGQRLELGNPVQWNFNPATNTVGKDRLYPPDAAPTVAGKIGANEFRQKRTLRDNLSAVQGMVVYHHETNSGEFPAACMATTAHPGTAQTIVNSRNFAYYPTSTTRLRADFLNGTGTNGWEFKFPTAYDTNTKFATQLTTSAPLGKALRNLAYFAGDPYGGAPSFKPFQEPNVATLGDSVHPAPYLNMWGDFSPLRRVFAEYLDAGVAYDALSSADKATLHSAACTVSLLAYNIKNDILEARALASSDINVNFQNIGSQMRNAMFRINNYLSYAGAADPSIRSTTASAVLGLIGKSRPWTDTNIDNATCEAAYIAAGNNDAAGYQKECDFGEYFAEYTRQDWITILGSAATNATPAEVTAIADFATKIDYLTSTIRDRELGFRTGLPQTSLGSATILGNNVAWDNVTGYTDPVDLTGSFSASFKLQCDPNFFGGTVAQGNGGEEDVGIFGYIGCSQSTAMNVRHPSLYYLFPLLDHDLDGGDVDARTQQPDGNILPSTTQVAEDYITDSYVRLVNPPSSATVLFKRVGTGTDPVLDVDNLAAVPSSATASTWTVPASSGTALTTANIDTRPFDINAPGGVAIKVPFLDKGMFDGREQMAVRVLDIDLNTLTDETNVSDYWISDRACDSETQDCGVFTEGIVYAAREDAVREDEIVRPKKSSQDPDDCLTVTDITSDDCRMIVTGTNSPQDPPLTAELISLKPVDFYADPDRRPHGFRLREGADMSRSKNRAVGMTFVTDNSVYVLGDFNLHSTAGTTATLIEEFTDTLGGIDWTLANFYDGRTDIDTNFAQPGLDTWRPVEILADAFTILSAGFIDGDADDTFTIARPANPLATNTSYMNQSRPNEQVVGLIRENGENGVNSPIPIWIDRNGSAYRFKDVPPPAPDVLSVETAPLTWTGLTTGGT
ncbi:MAG: hormogonium polysaccharide biosynthesis protein HpsA, partial [Nodosilinea sp.]